MRKSVTFRFDAELLERARRRALADNRSLTNYIETAILRAVERLDNADKSRSRAHAAENQSMEDNDK